MARWRQAVELGMTDEEIGTLAAIARSRSEARARRMERAQILLTYRETLVLCGGAKTGRPSSDGPAYYLECRDAEFEQKMAEVLCIYREVQVLKKAAKAKKPGKPVAIVSYDEKPEIQAIATTTPDLPPVPASTRPSRVIMSTNAMARSAYWPGSICSPGRFMPSSEIATAAGSSSNSSSFLMPPIQPARRSS